MEQSLLDLLKVPEASHVIYERPPLVLALCQVRFAQVLRVGEPSYVAPFQDAIRDQYPILHRGTDVQFVFNPTEGAVQGQAQSQHWRFADGRDEWTVVLANDFLTIETRAYNNFEEFLSRLQFVLNALIEHIRPTQLVRIGLRYIDEIREQALSWAEVIRPELLGALGTVELSESVQLAVHEILLRYSHERGINIHHGLIPTGTAVTPPGGVALPTNPFYLLDIDVFREFPAVLRQPMDPDFICRHAAEYNQVVYRLFRWIVSEQYLSTLGVRRVDSR